MANWKKHFGGVSTSVEGLDKLKWNLGKFTKEMEAAIPTALAAGGEIVRNEALGIMKNRYAKPIWKTGNLARSIHVEPVSKNEVRIGTNVEYGVYQEYGTKKMAARPYLRPAYDENREKIFEKIKTILAFIAKK